MGLERQPESDLSQLLRDVIHTFEEILDVFRDALRLSEAHRHEQIWLEDFTTALISWGVDIRLDSKSLMSIEGTAISRRISMILRNCKTQVEEAFTDLLQQRFVRHR